MHESLEKLTPSKRLFVLEYIKDFKPSKAAERAGLNSHTGSTYLKDDEIADAIAVATQERMARTEIDGDWVLMQLAQMFEADLADIVDEKGTLRPIHEWPEVWRKMTGSVKIKETFDGFGEDRMLDGFLKEVRIMDRLKILELIGKHTNIKAFSERIEVSSDSDLTARLMEGRRRAREITVKGDTTINFM